MNKQQYNKTTRAFTQELLIRGSFHRTLCSNSYLVKNSNKYIEFFPSSRRFSIVYEDDGPILSLNKSKFLLSYSVTHDFKIILNRIEIPKEVRNHGNGSAIIQVLKRFAALNSEDGKLRVKYPDNKSFWKHYKEKYGDVIFIYK